jgi:peptidyl-prolyl cis-trans isomerase C
MFFLRPRTFLIQLTLILALGLSACGSLFGTKATPTPIGPTAAPVPPTATPEPMALTVNGDGITVVEFKAELERYKSAQTALGKTVSDADASKAVIEDLIAQVLLAQAARAGGFDLSESALQSRVDALATNLGGADKLSAWEAAHSYDDASFRVALKRSAEAAWMRDKIVNAVPNTADEVHVQQILFQTADDANSVLAQLQGGADFNEMALKYDPVTHGDLGWFPKGYLLDAKIEEAAFNLQAGQISDVIQSDIGFHIIKVLERDPKHLLSPDAYLSVQDQALNEWVAQQRAQANIVLAP